MPSAHDRKAEALKSFCAKTDEFLCDIVKDAYARGFCVACALDYVATLVVAASDAVDHIPGALEADMPVSDFDDTPGHA